MKIKIYILFLLTLLSGGCRRILLDKESKSLQPYAEGDVLIFRNSHGQTDTITIEKIESYVNPTDPLDVFPTKTETLHVTGKISVREVTNDILGKPITKRSITLLKMQSTYKSNYFKFTFHNPNNGLKCPTTGLTVSDLKNRLEANSNRITIQAKEYYDNLSHVAYDLLAFEWDKDLGYTKFTYKENLTLELVEFIREGNY